MPATATERKNKPNDVLFNQKTSEANKTIEELKLKLAAISEKMAAGDSVKNSYSSIRQQLRAKFDDINRQKNELSQERNSIFEKVKLLQANIRKNNDLVKASKDKMGFKNSSDVDSQIMYILAFYPSNSRSLENRLQSGKLSLQEEKKIVADISNLKKVKKTFESFNSQQSNVESEKKAVDDLRLKIKEIDSKRDELKIAGDLLKKQTDDVYKEMESKMGKHNNFSAERAAIKSELDAIHDNLRTLRVTHKVEWEEYNVWYRAEAARKNEAWKQRQSEEKEAKLRMMAERELEKASILAYTEELGVCAVLTTYLVSFLPKEKVEDSVIVQAAVVLPTGSVALTKKSDREEDFLFGGKKEKKNKKSANAEKAKTFKLDLEMIGQFAKLKLEIPVSVSDIPNSLNAIEEKKKYFLENQQAKTKEALQAAREKIESLKKTEMESEIENVSNE